MAFLAVFVALKIAHRAGGRQPVAVEGAAAPRRARRKSDGARSLLSMSVLAPIRARGAHALASAQLLFRGLAVQR